MSRVGKTRCQESMRYPYDEWTVEGRLRTSDKYSGLFWGTCALCGKRHYNTPYGGGERSNFSLWLTKDIIAELDREAADKGISRSKLACNILLQHIETSRPILMTAWIEAKTK